MTPAPEPRISNQNQTVILPSPGGWRPPEREPARPTVEAAPLPSQANPQFNGINLIVALANPILNDIRELRTILTPGSMNRLSDHFVNEVQVFENQAYAAGVVKNQVLLSVYALCCLIDDSAGNTPWGRDGAWASHSVSTKVLGSETTGGEKFFEYLQKLLQNPHANCDVLELIHVCLSLGFQGQYRSKSNGDTILDSTRRELAECISRTRGVFEQHLSPHGLDANATSNPLQRVVRPWHIGVLCALLLFGVYLWLRASLSSISTPVADAIANLELKTSFSPQSITPRLATLLKAEIEAGQLESPAVVRCPGCETISLRFKSGAATLPKAEEPIVRRIGEALNQVGGTVTITGHTDHQKPGKFSPFADNWELSTERARSVNEVLAQAIANKARISSYVGRADRDWIGEKGATASLPANRRVEITLRPGSN